MSLVPAQSWRRHFVLCNNAILIYQKTAPLQTMHGLSFGLSQTQVNHWIHRLLPVLQQSLSELGMTPERDGRRVGERMETSEGGANVSLDRNGKTAATTCQ